MFLFESKTGPNVYSSMNKRYNWRIWFLTVSIFPGFCSFRQTRIVQNKEATGPSKYSFHTFHSSIIQHQFVKITIQILVLKTENTQADWITVSFYTQMGMPCYWPSLLYMKSIITNFLELLDFSRVHILEFQLYSAQYWFFWFKAN